MGYIGQTPTAVPLSSADIAPGTIEASDLNSTLNLSSKTVTLPASSVTSHVTSFDDSDIRSDILHLAIAQSLNDNRIAFSLEDSFVDTFEDSSGIDAGGNLTNVARDTASEYVSSVVTSGSAHDGNVKLSVRSIGQTNGSTDFVDDSATGNTITVNGDTNHKTDQYKTSTSSIYFDGTGDSLAFPATIGDIGSNNFTLEAWLRPTNTNTMRLWSTATDQSGLSIAFYTSKLKTYWSNSVGTWSFTITGTISITANTWVHIAVVKNGSDCRQYVNGVSDGSVTNSSAIADNNTVVYFGRNHATSDMFAGHMDSLRWSLGTARYSTAFTPQATDFGEITTTNATGTLISDPQTASTSRTSCSGVIIYSDAAGTNTLGTHLKIYFSCDNGSNWTESSSYGTPQTYSGTKKLVKLGATTCTAGNQILIKAVWAGQSASLEARLEGWAVNY